jgi:hypothetical protein
MNHTIDEYGTKYWRNDKGELHREDGPAIETIDKNRFWYQNNLKHRFDGPAIELSNGTKIWYFVGFKLNCINNQDFLLFLSKPICLTNNWYHKIWYNARGNIHREDGPAIEYSNGDKSWFINGKLHREDGPAYVSDFTKKWYINNELHRLDGPAVEYNGIDTKYWYYHNIQIPCKSNEEFLRIVKMKELL